MKVQAAELIKLIFLLKFPTLQFRERRALHFSVGMLVPTKTLSTLYSQMSF